MLCYVMFSAVKLSIRSFVLFYLHKQFSKEISYMKVKKLLHKLEIVA